MSIYFIQEKDNPTGLIKIGKASLPYERLSVLQSGCPVQLDILAIISTKSMFGREDFQIETELHIKFASSRVYGEWFTPSLDLWLFIKSLPVSEEITQHCASERREQKAKWIEAQDYLIQRLEDRINLEILQRQRLVYQNELKRKYLS